MSENPYQTSSSSTSFDGFSGDPSGGDPKLNRSVDMLRQTKPWVRFISVVMLVGSGFMVLGGIFAMAGGAEMGAAGTVIGVVYILMAMVYIIPAVFLWRYADRIAVFIREGSNWALSSALEAQKSFWKFTGILMAIVVAIWVCFFVLAFTGTFFPLE